MKRTLLLVSALFLMSNNVFSQTQTTQETSPKQKISAKSLKEGQVQTVESSELNSQNQSSGSIEASQGENGTSSEYPITYTYSISRTTPVENTENNWENLSVEDKKAVIQAKIYSVQGKIFNLEGEEDDNSLEIAEKQAALIELEAQLENL